MTDEEARGNIIFDDDYLSPMTTIVPDDWSLAEVSRIWIHNDECHECEVWYTPECYVVLRWPLIFDVGYGYPVVKVFNDHAQVKQYIKETK